MWRLNCSDEYDTEDIAETGRHFSRVSDYIARVFWVSLAFMIFDLLVALLIYADAFQKSLTLKKQIISYVTVRTVFFSGALYCYIRAL